MKLSEKATRFRKAPKTKAGAGGGSANGVSKKNPKMQCECCFQKESQNATSL